MENFNFQDLLSQAQAMQSQLATAQDRLADETVTGTSGGGLVTVTLTGTGDMTGLVIKPEAVDPDDVETLSDLVMAAVRDAQTKAVALQNALMPQMPGMGGAGF